MPKREREKEREKEETLYIRAKTYKNCAYTACVAYGAAHHAHEISRRSNPPSRAPRERPVATLLSTSLRPLPPLSLHPDNRLARIVAYGVADLDGATPSRTAGIPFHSVQPFNGPSVRLSIRLSVRPSVRPSVSLLTIYIPRHPSHPPRRQLRTRRRYTPRLEISDTNFSRILLFSPTALLKLAISTCSFHFSSTNVTSRFPLFRGSRVRDPYIFMRNTRHRSFANF